MIVVCPKASAGKESMFERGFFMHYLSSIGKKGVLADEVWESFRFRIKDRIKTVDAVEKIITNFRGIFKPESIRLDAEFQEVEPQKDYDNAELCEKTKDLITRRWAEIELFITEEPEKYAGTNVKIMTLNEFYIESMDNPMMRDLISAFCSEEAFEKQG